MRHTPPLRAEATDAADRIQLHVGTLHHWFNRAGFLPPPRPTWGE